MSHSPYLFGSQEQAHADSEALIAQERNEREFATPADSGFGCLLRSISRSQEILERATVYKARCGRRRPYLCERSALAYEEAFANWPHQPQGPKGTPAWDGWCDADQQDADAREYEAARAEERASQ